MEKQTNSRPLYEKFVVEKEQCCNGCSNLNFKLKVCKSAKEPVNTYTDNQGYTTVFKCSGCTGYTKKNKKKEG